jgi:DNA ligase-1
MEVSMLSLPTLYSKTATGAIQQWTVASGPYQAGQGIVTVEYGQVGGAIQKTVDIIKTGKNLGKANETTPEQQAGLKAKQLWDKKVKEGYVTDIDKAAAGETDLEGVEPMLAFPIEDKEKHVKFPALAQPKLDGFRCIAIVKNSKARLFSRTRKEILTLPHIIRQLESVFENAVLDGELYNHDLKHDFPRLASIIKRDELHPDHVLIQYHIYDTVAEGGYSERMKPVQSALLSNPQAKSLQMVETHSVSSRDELNGLFQSFLQDNYEGAMYRNPGMPYEHKRSAGLLKVKTMDDAEFEVIGVEEGSGKLMGKAGAMICRTADGKEFRAKMKGALDTLAEYLVNIDKYKGKMLTVQYQGLSPDGIPRFPVGLRFREEI